MISNDIDEPEEKTPTYKMKEEIEQVTKEMEEEKKRLRAKSINKGNLVIKLRRSVALTRMLMKIMRRIETTHQSKTLQTKMRQSKA